MLRLRTLGGLMLQADGRPVDGPMAQPRRLALLALLASAGERGISRDRVVGLLWSDVEEERARHSLGQLLHLIRRDGVGEAINVGGAVLRLDPNLLPSDLRDFKLALAQGERERAAGLYFGPFLDGFHLGGAVEFEQWTDAIRQHLSDQHRRCLDETAREWDARGDPVAAISRWRDLARLDLLDGRVALALMERLVAIGDRPGALRHGALHARALVAELGIRPSPPVQALIAELRQSEPIPSSDRPETDPGVRPPATVPMSKPAILRPRRGRWRVAAGVGAALLILAAAFQAARRRAVRLDPGLLMIAGFANRTGDEALGPLGDMATDYLARGLANTGLVAVVDGRDAGTRHRGPADSLDARTEARAVGAGRMLIGEMFRTGDTLVIAARVIDVGQGLVLASLAPVRTTLPVGTAVLELLRQRAMATFASLFDARLQDWEGATSPPRYDAYLEFLAGWDVFWRACDSCGSAGLAHIHRAIELDSSYLVARTTAASFHALLGECTATDSIARDLEPVAGLLQPVDRTQLGVATAGCRRNWSEALEIAREGRRAAPHSALIGRTLPLLAVLVNRPQEALDALDRIEPLHGWLATHPDPWWCRTQALHQLGRHHQELEAARTARSRFPLQWAMRVIEFEVVAAAALGREADVTSLLNERLSQPVDLPRASTPGELMTTAGLEFLVHRHSEAGRRALERAADWLDRAGQRDPSDLRHRFGLGRALFYLHRDPEARAAFQAVLATTTDSAEVIGYLAAIGTRQGDSLLATTFGAWLARQTDPIAWLGRARVAAIAGARDQAIQFLLQAVGAGLPYDVALHLNPEFDVLDQLPAYRELLRPKG